MISTHSALYLLLSTIAAAWTSYGVLLIRRVLPRLSAPPRLWIPIRVLLILLQFAAFLVVVLVAPAALLLFLAPRVDQVAALAGCGLWLYAFGALPFASAPFDDPAYVGLSTPLRKRYKLPVILFGAVFPACLLTAAALAAVALRAIPIPGMSEVLNSTPDATSIVLLMAAFGSAVAIGGYVGYRCWRFIALAFLPPGLVSAIARPKRPGVRAELAAAHARRAESEARTRD